MHQMLPSNKKHCAKSNQDCFWIAVCVYIVCLLMCYLLELFVFYFYILTCILVAL